MELKAIQLTKQYGSKTAVNHLNLCPCAERDGRILQQRSHPAQQLWAEFTGFGQLLLLLHQLGCEGRRVHRGQWQGGCVQPL